MLDGSDSVSMQGSFHQGSHLFNQDSAGRQCTCIALVALCAMKDSGDLTLTEAAMDNMLLTGDLLYQKQCIHSRLAGKWENSYLNFEELPDMVRQGQTYKVERKPYLFGLMESCSYPHACNTTFCDKVMAAFETSNFNLLMAGGNCIAFSKHQESYFIFDSHSHNTVGLPSAFGKSILMRFTCLSDFISKLVQVIMTLTSSNSQFEIQPLLIREKDNSSDPEVQLNSYFQDQAARNVSFQKFKPSKEACSRKQYRKEYMTFKRQDPSFRAHENIMRCNNELREKDRFRKQQNRLCKSFVSEELNQKQKNVALHETEKKRLKKRDAKRTL